MLNPKIKQVRRAAQQGFTLVEILIVIAIIAILMAVGIPQYNNYLDRTAVTACQTELTSYRGVILAESAFSQELTASQLADEVAMKFQACAVGTGDSQTAPETIAAAFISPAGEGVKDGVTVSPVRMSTDKVLEIKDGNITSIDRS